MKIDQKVIDWMAARVIRGRNERNVTRQKLADGIGRDIVYVIQLEDGQIDPELPDLVAIGKFLEIPIMEFFGPLDNPVLANLLQDFK
jgi:transcriptional regulator with XRE-family HTH domain